MIRRWLVRSVVLVLLTLCVVGWVGSYWQFACVEHLGGERVTRLGAECGSAFFYYIDRTADEHFTWQWRHAEAQRWDYESAFSAAKYHFAGFGFVPNASFDNGWGIFVPLWFPTFFWALVFLLVWRRTKAKVKKGFPVQVVEGGGAGRNS